MNQSFLPSRKIVGVVIIPLLTISALWLIGDMRQERTQQAVSRELQLQDTLRTVVNEYNTKDTDGDLLKDWEEFLHETDISNSDTDGDGLDDYTEVLDPLRDPLVADAELGRTPIAESPEPTSVVGGGVYYAEDPNLNVTEKFSRDIFNTFAQLRQSGNPELVQDSIVNVVTQTALDRAVIVSGEYTLEDIQTRPSAGLENDRSLYLRQYNDAFKPLEGIPDEDLDLVLVTKYTQTKQPLYLEKLQENIVIYEQFLADLVAMEVPEPAAEIHLELVNNVSILLQDVITMSRVDTDPLGTIIAASTYFDNDAILQQTLRGLSLYLHGK